MARMRRSFAVSNRGPKRLNAWALGPGFASQGSAAVLQLAASAAPAAVGSGVTPSIPNLTVMRIRGTLLVSLTAANVQRSGFQMTFGIGIVTADAFVVGSTALPGPFEDSNWPGWLWLGGLDMRTGVGALAVGDPSINPARLEIESKAMRKFRLNEVLFMAVDTEESGTATVDIRGSTRVLLKLP